MIDKKTLDKNSEMIRNYYKQIVNITSGYQKKYYSFITEKGLILPVDFIPEKCNYILSKCKMHECYKNCYEFMFSTLGRIDDLVFEYCEGELWVNNSFPLHHAWIKVNDLQTNTSWFIDPTLQSINRLDLTDTYIAFKSFGFREFIDTILENQVHGEVFNTWARNHLNANE